MKKRKKRINKNNEIFIISNIGRKNNIEFQTTHKLTLQVDSTPRSEVSARSWCSDEYLYTSYFTLGLSAIFRRRVGSRILLMR